MGGELGSVDFGFSDPSITVMLFRASLGHRHLKSLYLSPAILLEDFTIQRCPLSNQVSQF